MIGFLFAMICFATSSLAHAQKTAPPFSRESGAAMASWLAEHTPEYNRKQFTAVFLLNKDDCMNCNMVVINSTSEQIRIRNPRANIVVVVQQGSAVALDELSKKLRYGSAVLDTLGFFERVMRKQLTPELLLMDQNGKPLARYTEINQQQPDVAAAMGQGAQPSIPVESRSLAYSTASGIGSIRSVVLDSTHEELILVDELANSIRFFDAISGQETKAYPMKDEIRNIYYDSNDAAWRSMLKRGGGEAQYSRGLLSHSSDTLYVLSHALGGYRQQYEPAPGNSGDSSLSIVWTKRQVLTCWVRDTLRAIFLPRYDDGRTITGMAKLSANEFVTTLLWGGYVDSREDAALRSSYIFQTISPDFSDARPFISIKEMESATKTPFDQHFTGAIAGIDADRFCYLNQLNNVFGVVERYEGRWRFRTIVPRRTLAESMRRKKSAPSLRDPFNGIGWVATGLSVRDHHIHVLCREIGKEGGRFRLQTYDVSGEFISERDVESDASYRSAFVAGYDGSGLVLVAERARNEWQILRLKVVF